ncbi:MAG: FtsH protease activity modulator HflK [Rhodobacteraceae bacterium]|nr:FtsH protease activity modulator HflK [Paracoccaceae bacterium]
MPSNNNSGGPWGGGGNNGGDDDGRRGQRPPPPGGPQQVPDIDELIQKGQEKLKALIGGGGSGGGDGAGGIGKGGAALIALAVVGLWAFNSFYTVKPEEKSVELFLGEYYKTGDSGLNFAPWPVVRAEIVQVTGERIENIGVGGFGRSSQGLMLTGDENIVDIDFQVVWNITDPAQFLFNLADPQETIRAVSESAMREVIGRSNFAPILNEGRRAISQEVEALIQATLDSYDSGVNIVRLNLEKADPPSEVIEAVQDVQAAEQERDTLEKRADAYSNQALAEARGQAAELIQQAEGYRAQVVNIADGEASRFVAVHTEYLLAPEVTRKRLYLETMERVLGGVNIILLEETSGQAGSGVVPYLPLNELIRGGANQ